QTSLLSGSANVPLHEDFGKELAKIEGIKHVDARRFPFIKVRGHNMQLYVLEMDKFFDISRIEPKDGKYDQMVGDLKKGGSVAVSAMLAKKFGYKKGDSLILNSPSGKARLKIVGIMNDAGVEPGIIYIDRSDYKKYWKDDAVDGFAVKVAEGYSADDVSEQIRQRWNKNYGIKIRENKEFTREVLSMVDQQFALTNMVIYIAILVAAFGIMNTSLISILQRKRELSVIRALGARRRQIKNIILGESLITGLIGATSGGIIGIGLGAVMVIGQGLLVDLPVKYYIPWIAIVGGFVITLVLTTIGSIIPSRAALRTEIVEGISYE
ncbi:MAG TPA: FtsX-like permease family protein, partial [Anaerolineae bacterium]|nr:FtsX-like permease family protein [Anaerolineae bacterium]